MAMSQPGTGGARDACSAGSGQGPSRPWVEDIRSESVPGLPSITLGLLAGLVAFTLIHLFVVSFLYLRSGRREGAFAVEGGS